jgi:3-hydroxyisobutyrate dehydrogenase
LQTIGIIGLGNMGRGMALTLLRKGFAVIGHDATPATRAALAAEGVAVRDSAAAAAGDCDMVVLSLPTADIVESVVAGPDGLAGSARPGLIVIDTSTSHPETSRRMASLLAGKGAAFLDCPVSGGPKGAHAGTMTMVIGGDSGALARAEPVLAAMTGKRVHVGPVGAGHATKLVNNMLCAAHLLLAGEALRMAGAAGVEPERLLAGLNAGSGRSGVTEVNLPLWVLNGAFDSGFTMKLMRKDVRLAAEVFGADGLPMAAEAARLWASSADAIGDSEDFNRIVGFREKRA